MPRQTVSPTNLAAHATPPLSTPSTLAWAEEQKIDVQLITADELCGEIADRWNTLRLSNENRSSPYFDINFTKAVAKVRDDVQVAMFLEDDDIVGFLPFQLNSIGRAVPAGGRLNDYHGIIGSVKDAEPHFAKLFQTCGLKSYAFHALPVSETFRPYAFREVRAHHLDLSIGWEGYRKWVRKHSSTVKRQGQKTRKLEKAVGPIRFEFDAFQGDVLERLIELKSGKYQRTNTFDILGVQWAANLLRELQNVKHSNFRGILQAMWAGDELVCAHFGMQTDTTLHYWFPIFDHRFSQYSPGTEMMMRVAHECCQRGIDKLDLGYGDDPWKFKFCNANTKVLYGQVNFSPFEMKMAKTRYVVRNKLKEIPLKPLAKSILRKVFPGFGQWNFQ
jgi:CelD/BcsL family acetyltransferase involved in cellulose biosynthesis